MTIEHELAEAKSVLLLNLKDLCIDEDRSFVLAGEFPRSLALLAYRSMQPGSSVDSESATASCKRPRSDQLRGLAEANCEVNK